MLKLNFLIRFALCFLFVMLPLTNLDEWFYDKFFRIRGKRIDSKNNIVLIEMADPNPNAGLFSDQPLGIPTPEIKKPNIWNEQFHGALLSKLLEAHPRLIIVTTYFSSASSIHPYERPEILFSGILNEEYGVQPPPTTLTTQDNYGFTNLFPHPDNTIRSSALTYSNVTSLAFKAYRLISDDPLKRDLLKPIWIDYRGPQGTYPTFLAYDVVNSPELLEKMRDKIVLLGNKERSQLYGTPFGPMSRLEIQANVIDTVLSHKEITFLPPSAKYALSILAVFAAVGIILYFPLKLGWILLLLVSGLYLLVSLLIFAYFKIWIDVANPLICILGSHLVLLGFKLSREEEKRWKLLQEAEYLKEVDQFKNNFISLFSHDLKTPIAKIKALTSKLLSTPLPAETHTTIRAIDNTSSQLEKSISDILKVTRMELLPIEPSREVIDLNRLVESSVKRLNFLADQKQIGIVMDLEPLFSMEGDAKLLAEVIHNLLENAIKYSPDNTQIILRTKEENNRVWVAVVDEGVGIPPDEIPRVTGKFYRGKSAPENVKGSGLGLYLCKYFVECHGGGLEIKSELAKGTEIRFWLPLATT